MKTANFLLKFWVCAFLGIMSGDLPAETVKFESYDLLLNDSIQTTKEVRSDLDQAMKIAAQGKDAEEKLGLLATAWNDTESGKKEGATLPIGLAKVNDFSEPLGQIPPNSIYQDQTYLNNLLEVIEKGVSGRAFGVEAVVAKRLQHRDCVAVGRSGTYGASGVIIAKNLVLTAAHICADDPESVPDMVWLGTVTPGCEDAPKKGQALRVIRYCRHPDYKFKDDDYRNPLANDLMMLEIDSRDLGPIEETAVLATQADAEGFGNKPLTSVRAVGFGHSRRGFQNKLEGLGVRRYVTVHLASQDPVRYGLHQTEKDGSTVLSEFVTGSKSELADTCKGDSGGPLYIVDKNGSFKLIGITCRSTPKAGVICGDGSINTYLPVHQKWIDDTSKKIGDWKAVE